MNLLEKDAVQSILIDDLDRAGHLLDRNSKGNELLADLLSKVKGLSTPLDSVQSSSPMMVQIPTTFVCKVGCKMCNTGFQDRTAIYENRPYLKPEELEEFFPWIETATHVNLVGSGETLDSPYISDLLEKISGKISMITTSGVPLNRAKAVSYLKAGLKYLNFSFDGQTTLGHGGGKESYSRKFWEKVEMVQNVKRELNSKFPIIILNSAINQENLSSLDDLLATAFEHRVDHVDLKAMVPLNTELYKSSLFVKFENSVEQMNPVISRWRKKGLDVTVAGQKEMEPELGTCYFIDNYLFFNRPDQPPRICCGPLDFPLDFFGLSKGVFWKSFPLRYLRYLHFHGGPEVWPMVCKACTQINPKGFAKIAAAQFLGGSNPDDTYALYQKASKLKIEQRDEEAEKKFFVVLDRVPDDTLKGKTYFHLGELRIRAGRNQEALSFMKLAVRHCYDHGKAFAYLYLLLMLLDEPKSSGTVKPMKETYMEEISRAHELL